MSTSFITETEDHLSENQSQQQPHHEYQSDFEESGLLNHQPQNKPHQTAASSLCTTTNTTATTSTRQSSQAQQQSRQQSQHREEHGAPPTTNNPQQVSSSSSPPPPVVIHQQQLQKQQHRNNNNTTRSHQEFLYQNGKSPLPITMNNQSSAHQQHFSVTNTNTNQSYSAPEPLPFGSPVPLSQQLFTSNNNTELQFHATNNNNESLNVASRSVYTAQIARLRQQLQETQRSLQSKQVECEMVRNEMSQRDREGNTRLHTELKNRVESEVASLTREHNRQIDALRSHYEDMIEQLHGRVKSSENEAEELRLRVATMTSKVTEAQSISQRDKQNLEAAQKRFEAELSSLKERHHEEIEHMKKEIDVTRSSVDGRDQVSFSQVASLQSDIRRLQSELENTRNHASRLQSERDEDNRRNREDRDTLQRECDAAVRRATDRVKNAEANEREALDRALRSERQLSEERARRERLSEELAGTESKEHETQRVLARKEAEIARLEARIEALQVKANTFANEAAAVRHEFDVRDSRDRAQEKLEFDQKLISFRERTELKSLPAPPAPSSQYQTESEMQSHHHHLNSSSSFTTPVHHSFRNNVNQQQSLYQNNNNLSHHSSSSSTAHQRALQEVLDATVSEMKDLKRSLQFIPQTEYSRRAPAIENRIETCLDEIKRLNERVSRTEASQVRFAQNTNQHQQQFLRQQQQLSSSTSTRPPLMNSSNSSNIRHTPATVDYSPAMKKVRDLKTALES